MCNDVTDDDSDDDDGINIIMPSLADQRIIRDFTQITREERQFQLEKLKLEQEKLRLQSETEKMRLESEQEKMILESKRVRLQSEQKTRVELEKEKMKQMEIEANKFVAAQRRGREMVTPDTRFKVQETGIKTLLEAMDKADVITEAYRSLQEHKEKGHSKLQGSKRQYMWNSGDGRGYTDEVMLGVCSDIPIPGVHVILGNDLCGSSVLPEVLSSDIPNGHQNNLEDEKCDNIMLASIRDDPSEDDQKDVYPACVVTLAQNARLRDVPERMDVSSAEEEELEAKEILNAKDLCPVGMAPFLQNDKGEQG
ncbi:glutamic acid-rich protein-like [Procambarus clarkii]|uniref:glutamic acid-rich protein-like n=1 Tax=Procambarus clarkii TaxID=6728 RepID=UPI003744AEB8